MNAMLKIPTGMDVSGIASLIYCLQVHLNLFVPVSCWHASKQYKSSSLTAVSVQVDGFMHTWSLAVDASTYCVECDGSCIIQSKLPSL